MASALQPRSTEIPSASQPASRMSGYIPFAVGAALLIGAFWRILTGIYGSWFDPGAYMEHGILVVPAAAYMVWVKRDVLRKIPQQRSAAGLLLLLWGALQ